MSQMREKEFLTPAELLERWKGIVEPSTLVNWRAQKKGPKFVKLGGKVAYRLSDVQAFEASSEVPTK